MLRKLRVYDASGAKRYMLVHPNHFIAALRAHLDEHEHTVFNAALNTAFDAAVLNPDALPDASDREFYAPPHYSRVEIVLDRPAQPYEKAYTRKILDAAQTLWGRILLRVSEYCEQQLNGRPK
jgi:hypothetical protein